MAATHPLLPQVEHTLRQTFGSDIAIFPEAGFEHRLVIKVISPQFNGRSEKEKQELVWDSLRAAMGEDSTDIGVVIVYGTDEI